MQGDVIWTPTPQAWEQSLLADFAAASGRAEATSYDELLDWSLADSSAFWGAFANWFDVLWHDDPTAVLADAAMPGARWFPGATLNYAEHLLVHVGDRPREPAVIERSQTRDRVELSWRDLAEQVARCQAGLRRVGVERGDRVVAYAPNIHETLVAFLATASLGAVWSSCAPEFGVKAVIDRCSQVEPKVLFAVDGYGYGTKTIDRRSHVAEIVAALPTLQSVIHIDYVGLGGLADTAVVSAPAAVAWDELLAEPGVLEFASVPFDHPLYVLFSSGTTGLPKPIVHGHGGITLEHAKAMLLHYDLRAGERFMWFSTTGWMMWNFAVSALIAGATAVLFDGDPASPDLAMLWGLAAEEQLDVLGLGAPLIGACQRAGLRPGDDLDLARLRHVGSTGAPLSVAGFEWITDAVGAHVQPGSMSGGTDVCTAFLGPTPVTPVRSGEISRRMLGCDVRAVRPDGQRCDAGETGELVIAAPMPSMPVGFWADEDGSRYRAAYFETFPGFWHHGDWITFTDDGACTITGRSDATLNRGGVRLGTADFYAVIDAMPEITSSVVVHLEDAEDAAAPGQLVLLVAVTPGVELDDTLRQQLRTVLRTELSPRHVPDEIEAIPVVPHTLSGKKLEVPIKRILRGADPAAVVSRDSLADPAALDAIIEWAAQRG